MKRSALKRKTPLRARGKKARAKASRTEKRERAGLGPRFYVDALPVALNLADFRIYAPRPDPKPAGPWRSPEYLAFVRTKPCCVCGKPGPSEAHHWGGKGSHGMGQKCSDALTAPLCRAHHEQWHLSGTFSGYRWAGEGAAVTARKLSRADAERIQIEAQRDCLAEWVAR